MLRAPTIRRWSCPLKPFGDGGWYWFELVAGKSELTLLGGVLEHQGPAAIAAGEVATIQITTMNKPDFCIDNARILGENPHALNSVKEVLIVDQGANKVSDAEGFDDVSAPPGRQASGRGSGQPRRLRRVLPAAWYEAVDNGSEFRPAA